MKDGRLCILLFRSSLRRSRWPRRVRPRTLAAALRRPLKFIVATLPCWLANATRASISTAQGRWLVAQVGS
jgi:hypothetical protein